jgi:hypothetical protein
MDPRPVTSSVLVEELIVGLDTNFIDEPSLDGPVVSTLLDIEFSALSERPFTDRLPLLLGSAIPFI